jgi:hypothetical protein
MEIGKVKCWEFMECGPDIYSSCPAFLLGAGRKCWFVAGTFCGKKVRGINAMKLTSCKECKFYQYMKSWDKLCSV